MVIIIKSSTGTDIVETDDGVIELGNIFGKLISENN